MVETHVSDEVLREIEEDLRREEALWGEIHRDLSALKGPTGHIRRLDSAIAAVVVVACMAVAAFGIGWFTGPTEPSGNVAAVQAELIAARSDLADYSDSLMRMSSHVGRLNGELVRTQALVSASAPITQGEEGIGPVHSQGPHPETS